MAMFNFWWLALALVISGIGVSPAIAVLNAIVSSSVKFSEPAAAFGWTGTGLQIGAALGSAVAGFCIDGIGSLGGFAVSTGLALLGLVAAMVVVRRLPDLRSGSVGPIPDTEPIPLPPS